MDSFQETQFIAAMELNEENQELPIFRDISSLDQLSRFARTSDSLASAELISNKGEVRKRKPSPTAEKKVNFENSEKRKSRDTARTWMTSSTNSLVASRYRRSQASMGRAGSATAVASGIWTSHSDPPARDQRIDQWTPESTGETPTPGKQDPYMMNSDSQIPSSWIDRQQACGLMDTEESLHSS